MKEKMKKNERKMKKNEKNEEKSKKNEKMKKKMKNEKKKGAVTPIRNCGGYGTQLCSSFFRNVTGCCALKGDNLLLLAQGNMFPVAIDQAPSRNSLVERRTTDL